MPHTIDITKLFGEDLFNALGTSKKIVVQRKSKDKLSPKTPTLKWQDERLILLTHITECTCGHTYSHPNAILFLKRKASDGSLHYVDIEGKIENPEERFLSIPIEQEFSRSQVHACEFCYNILHIMDRARAPKETPPVELSPSSSHTTSELKFPAYSNYTPPSSFQPEDLQELTEELLGVPLQPILGD